MKRELCALACVAVLVAACTAPDLKRGKAELEAGETEAAEADLLPLAELGYEDAKVALARVYAKRADPESLEKAIALYKELLEDNPAVAVPLAKTLLSEGAVNPASIEQAEKILLQAHADGDETAAVPLLVLYSDFPERDKKQLAPRLADTVAGMRTPEAEAAAIKWYRRNAAADERIYKALIKRCAPARDRIPECYVDLARHYRFNDNQKALRELVTAGLGRYKSGNLPPPILERLGWSLASEDYPGKALPEVAYPLMKEAAEHSDVSKVRLARLLIEYPHLDPDARPEQLLLKAQNNPEAQLALGRLYLDGKLAPADPAKALKHFERAAATIPTAHYYIGRIYKRGYLGNSDPVKAARHYLTAARAGYPRADQALAQLYSDNRGVRPNLVNAYVFASIAAQAETPEGAAMLRQIRAAMKPDQIEVAERLLQQELATRTPAPADTAAMQTRPAPQADGPQPVRPTAR